MKNEDILQKLGIAELNAMQQEAYEAILRTRNDVLILSPTGSGKTLAYMLPLVQLLNADSVEVQALVVVPGRELAWQSDHVLKSMGSGLRSQSCYGGRAAMDEHRLLRKNRPQLVFGTPGRLNDHLSKGNINAGNIRFLVIDEFDKCLEMGFHDEMQRLLQQLPSLQRRILLSATDAEQIPHFVEMQRTSRLGYLDTEEPVPDRVEVYQVACPQKDKLDTLYQLLLQLGNTQSIVFLNYRDSVERVSDFLRKKEIVVSSFHGGLEQRQREDALYQFANGSATVLVSTDLASRGLDIPKLDNVIHYHLPLNEEALIHRVGRTARWDEMGRTFFLVGPDEKMPDFRNEKGTEGNLQSQLWEINSDSSADIPIPLMATIYIGKGKKDKISKGDIVGFLCKIGGLKPSEIGRIDVNDRYAYVAISRSSLKSVLAKVKGQKLKGLKTIVEPISVQHV
ncbi:DEAD/DEAH box helicase [Prevotella sp. E9-3]|uniref:DEAD/DEAH box helicase n=1 Tax=Prevotella sp. E9-3 TaxID=2913621 RepID=UPI001EDBA7E0|nr:DEAD/DEAH box helicase [Prevotella sp. E9-3]UKK47226.1 DEAD/DEAH box helicase [Prevotella sp. E9-3]